MENETNKSLSALEIFEKHFNAFQDTSNNLFLKCITDSMEEHSLHYFSSLLERIKELENDRDTQKNAKQNMQAFWEEAEEKIVAIKQAAWKDSQERTELKREVEMLNAMIKENGIASGRFL